MENTAATISIKTTKKLKEDFERICDEMGMSMATACTIFIKKVVKNEGFPFDVTTKSDDNQIQRLVAYYSMLQKSKTGEEYL